MEELCLGSTAESGRIPRNLSARDRMCRKILSKRVRETYKLRHMSLEPVIGQIKWARNRTQFTLRGLVEVRSLWRFDCAVQLLEDLPGKKPRRSGSTRRNLSPGCLSQPTPLMDSVLKVRRPNRSSSRYGLLARAASWDPRSSKYVRAGCEVYVNEFR